MKVESKLAKKIETGDFIVTAECAPGATASGATAEAALKALGSKPVAVNVADNSHGVALSSMAASVAAMKSGIEPVLQMVTRDRNRIALQSDLLVRQLGNQECALHVRLSSDTDRGSGIG